MNKKNKLAVWLCLVLTVLMVVSAIPAGAISVSLEGVKTPEQTENTPNSAGEIDVDTGNPALDDSVPVGKPGEGYTPVGTAINSTEDFKNMDPNGKYYLAADIAVNNTYSGFAGVFDGNGHTVTVTVPMFTAPQSATIKNLVVEGNVSTVNGDNTAAVASGTSFDCNFFNILNKANVTTPEGVTGSLVRASGIAGRTNGYTIVERCTNEGTIIAENMAAGIVALLSADESSEAVVINCVNKGVITSTSSNAAGITVGAECPIGVMLFYNCRNEGAIIAQVSGAGILNYSTRSTDTASVRIVGCTNTAVITGNENGAGGIMATADTDATIENCKNEATGKVYGGKTSTSNQRTAGGILSYSKRKVLVSGCENYADIEGAGQSGGIVGQSKTNDGTVQNCKNTGNVTSRLNYAAGIIARLDTITNWASGETNNVIKNCTNEGNVTTRKGNVAGIVSFSQDPVTIIGCTNKGNVGAREDTQVGESVAAGGIAGWFPCPVTIIDCTNNGNVTGKSSYTVSDENTVTAQSGGQAGGILAGSGDGTMLGVTRVTGCVNTGNVTSGVSRMDNPATNSLYAGGIVGYQYGSGASTYLEMSYCINTGNVTAGTDASYALGYGNLPYAIFKHNVFAGKLKSQGYQTGKTADGASVLNVLFWNNASTLPAEYYFDNWVVESFEGTMIKNYDTTNKTHVSVGMSDFTERFGAEDDPFEVMENYVEADYPRDTATLITSAEEFLAMSPIGNYKLANDITLSESYTGCKENENYNKYFLGTFDGDGHTITVNGQPAFSYFASGAVLRNVTLKGSVTNSSDSTGALGDWGGATFINITNYASVTSCKNTGGILGSVAGLPGRFENCVNYGTIVTTATGENAGGICGYVSAITCRFVNCTNYGKVTSNKAGAGGIAGYNSGNYSTFVNCTNNGEITSTVLHAGGILGQIHTPLSANPMISGCVNTGKITSTPTSGTCGAGGICGYNGNAMLYIQNCYNSGEVSGSYAAGIHGDSAKGVVITACVNTGTITSTGSCAGGIANHHTDNNATHMEFVQCVNAGKITGKNSLGGITGCISNLSFSAAYSYCINVGEISGTGVNVGALNGYTWGNSSSTGIDVQNCIAAGTVTTTGARAGVICGYMNSNKATIKNNVLASPVTATGTVAATSTEKAGTHLYYDSNGSAITAKANIASNLVVPGIAMFDAQKGNGATQYALGTNSTGTVAANDFAIDEDLGNVLLAAGIIPTSVDGAYHNAFRSIFGGADSNATNQVAVCKGDTQVVVSTLTEASKYLTDGATVKLLANYYAGVAENIYSDGISYTFDGNGFNLYAANAGRYLINFSGSGEVNMVNLKVYAQAQAVRVGLNRCADALKVTFNNAKIYAGSASENGYIRRNASGLSLLAQDSKAMINIRGDETEFKNGNALLMNIQNALTNIEGGTYATHGIALETRAKNSVVNINGGTFYTDFTGDNALITVCDGTININDGKFTGPGMCVVRVLGGKTAKEFGLDNTISTATNAQLNIHGGEFVLNDGYNKEYSAVVRCGGGSTYGSVVITGGTFVDKQTAGNGSVINKNNTCASLTITGGKFLASENQKYFVMTSGCANVKLADGYQPTDSHTNRATSAYSGTCTYEGNTYKVWTLYGATNSDYAMTTESGAQVRMVAGSTGLRFISTITAEKIAAAKTKAGANGSVTYGTVIAPLDYVLRADAFTMEALDAKLTDVAAGKRYVDIEAKDGLIEDEDGNVEIRAALTNIKTGNLTRAFAAVSYVKVVDGNGTTTYYYSAFDAVENVRAIRQVAEAALADTKETAEGAYTNAILDGEGNVVAYSRYNDAQRAVLKTFVAEEE